MFFSIFFVILYIQVNALNGEPTVTIPTTTPPPTYLDVLHLYNDTVLAINTTYNATVDLLANKTETFRVLVEDYILFRPASQIEYYLMSNRWQIMFLVYQSMNQGTYNESCQSFVSDIENIPSFFTPQIVSCVYEESNKTQAYYDIKNFSIPFELTKFPSDIWFELGNCDINDIPCLNYVSGDIKNHGSLTLRGLKEHQSDILNKEQESEDVLDKCQMLKEAEDLSNSYLNKLSTCLQVERI